MRNIKLIMEYDGSNYIGWQKQNKGVSIQETVEKSIFEITRENISLISSGRTDAGVHALGQVVNFKSSTKIPLEKLLKGINAKLPLDIVVTDIEEVDIDFHSRYNSKKKRYRYVILNKKNRCAVSRNYVYHVPYELNIEKMRMQAKLLLGEHDFKSFMSSGSSSKSTIRTIYDVSLEKNEDYIIFEIEGNGFLYNMVRIIVGTLIDIEKGKINRNIDEIIDEKNRNISGHTALASGLFLKKVFY